MPHTHIHAHTQTHSCDNRSAANMNCNISGEAPCQALRAFKMGKSTMCKDMDDYFVFRITL